MAGRSSLLIVAVCAVTLLHFGEVNATGRRWSREELIIRQKQQMRDQRIRKLAADILRGEEIPSDLVRIGDNQYFLGDRPLLNFPEATKMCDSLNMTLVALDSKTKTDELVSYILEQGMGRNWWWTSGVKVHDSFIWTGTGQVMSYNGGWFGGNPNVGAGPDTVCVFVSGDEHGIGDTYCKENQSFICEMRQ